MKKIVLSAILLLPVAAAAQTTPQVVIPAESASIHVSAGSSILVRFTVEIPRQGYIYANPKGPGTGKPLTLAVKTSSPQGSILAQLPEKHVSDPSDAFVWTYRERADFYLPLTVIKNETVVIEANGLYCEASGRCIPFSTSSQMSISTESPYHPTAEPPHKKLFVHGDPSIHPVDLSSGAYDPFAGARVRSEETAQPLRLNGVSAYDFPPLFPEFINSEVANLPAAVLFGFLAGIILNLMPCVLPVLSLKISGIVRNSENRSSARRNGLVYCAGIFTSFLILAGLASFAGYGWGALFQRREFIAVMILVLFLMALSMLGVFTLNIPGFASRLSGTERHSTADSFVKGLIASLLATPCSGPLLGSTLAWSLTEPPVVIFTVFASVGAGMAFPFFILSIRPSLAGFLPRPGKWMIGFERIMGILLLGSVLYFMYILGKESAAPAAVMLASAGVSAAVFGKFGSPLRSFRSRVISRILAAVLAGAGFVMFMLLSPEAGQTAERKFSFAEVVRNSGNGMITVVDFTADWCPNCRIVERTVLRDEETILLMKRSNAVLLKADITNPDTEAEALLHTLGSRSIPFLAIFPAGGKSLHPVCLRDIYTKGDFRKALERAGNAGGTRQ
jgi:thiol:disulfide interchange protein DsbD